MTGPLFSVVLMNYQCRLGSARAINRRYISDCVPSKIRLQASAGFVSASALGMACGPALAGLLQTKFKIYFLTFNQDTLPGWIMALAWLLYLFWLWISFREPTREAAESHPPQDANAGKLEFMIIILPFGKNLLNNHQRFVMIFSNLISI